MPAATRPLTRKLVRRIVNFWRSGNIVDVVAASHHFSVDAVKFPHARYRARAVKIWIFAEVKFIVLAFWKSTNWEFCSCHSVSNCS